jgi:hypothetical protein
MRGASLVFEASALLEAEAITETQTSRLHALIAWQTAN